MNLSPLAFLLGLAAGATIWLVLNNRVNPETLTSLRFGNGLSGYLHYLRRVLIPEYQRFSEMYRHPPPPGPMPSTREHFFQPANGHRHHGQ